jgi:hypothetical protein
MKRPVFRPYRHYLDSRRARENRALETVKREYLTPWRMAKLKNSLPRLENLIAAEKNDPASYRALCELLQEDKSLMNERWVQKKVSHASPTQRRHIARALMKITFLPHGLRKTAVHDWLRKNYKEWLERGKSNEDIHQELVNQGLYTAEHDSFVKFLRRNGYRGERT